MKTLSTKADMEWRDRCGNIAQVRKSGVATTDWSILGGPELDLVKSMDMTGLVTRLMLRAGTDLCLTKSLAQFH